MDEIRDDAAPGARPGGPSGEDGEAVLSVRNLKVHFSTRLGLGKAVDGVSFDLRRGETLGLVGESGCGKSITSLALVGLLPEAARVVDGEVRFAGENLLEKSMREMRQYRGRRIGMILQDPMAALNPVFSIKDQLFEPLRLLQRLSGAALRNRAVELLRLMRIPSPEERLGDYPHQFSGGMRQRIVGAISLSSAPEVLIADEPTTALDVTIQAAFLELLKEIQRARRLSILFITHDFGVVGDMCDRIAVMYAGKIVEMGSTWEIFDEPSHPYTKALLRSVPDVRETTERLVSIEGAPPSAYRVAEGCPFRDRCWLYEQLGQPERCVTEMPPLVTVATGQEAACHFDEEARSREVIAAGRR